MAVDDLPEWAAGAVFLGPVLSATADSPFRDVQPLCATCPVGQWYRTQGSLRCFCGAFRTEMFAERLPVVLACDAREYSLLEEADERPDRLPGVQRP